MRPALAVVLFSAVFVAGCGQGHLGVVPAPTLVPLRTQQLAANTICLQALGGGTLVMDPVSGLGLQSGGNGHVLDVWWPYGWSTGWDGSKLGLVDEHGVVVAHLRDLIQTAGGLGNANDWAVCGAEPIKVLATGPP
jgi:hypothetical protein